MTRTPAYSRPFSPEGIQLIDPDPAMPGVTPEWAWGGSTGAGVKVAVIDSGVDASHPAVGHVEGYVAVEHDGTAARFALEAHEDAYGHGTACAGIIRSIAPDVDLYSVKVLGGALSGQGTVFAAGLQWAIENGMHVCNLSLGTTKRDFYAVLHDLADMAYFRNVVLVTAANNMPKPSFPSVYASVVAVASHTESDPYRFYFNPQPPVEFGAPGIDVRVAWTDGSYVTSTGNSYAAPHMTGIIARILGKHPRLTTFQVKAILRALSANVRHPDADASRAG